MIQDHIEAIFCVLWKEFGLEFPPEEAHVCSLLLYRMIEDAVYAGLKEEMRLHRRDFLENLRTNVCQN